MAIPTPDSSAAPAASAAILSDEARAGALWTFLKARAPRFTFEQALEAIRALSAAPGEDHKVLAKRLRKVLHSRGISLKQGNALHAVARLSGYTSWHTADALATPRLRFTAFEGTATAPQSREFATWRELAAALQDWADRLHARGQLPLSVLTLNFTGRALNFMVPVPRGSEEKARPGNEIWLVGSVVPLQENDQDWLAEAPSALEKLRRHLEETGKAVLDGYAALYFCANSSSRFRNSNAVTFADVVNSELVLLREDNEGAPHHGYEIARGDELTCWHQLELSLRDGTDNGTAIPLRVNIPEEGSGAWYVNGIRHVWALETLKPNEFVPGRVHHLLGIPDCERLLRRYKLARRIHSGGFLHRDMNKRVDYLSGLPQTWRVDLHRLLHILRAAGLTWESYIEQFGAEKLPMQTALPVGFVIQLLDDLKVENPNQVFAWPTQGEMELVRDDRLLCSLMPRVDSVRYAKPRDLAPDALVDLHEAVQEFADGLRLQKMVAAGGIQTEDELPYLVYVSDAQELRLAAESMGLQMYVAVSPHLTSTEGLLPDIPGVKTWPWALGHALLLRFVREGDKQ